MFCGVESRTSDQNQEEMESLSEEETKKIKTDNRKHNLSISRSKDKVQGKINTIRQTQKLLLMESRWQNCFFSI